MRRLPMSSGDDLRSDGDGWVAESIPDAAVREAAEAASRGERDAAMEALTPRESVRDSVRPELQEFSGPTSQSARHLPADEREEFQW